MLKGTTTIELTDVKSGQVRKITHENMVTNCVNDMLKNAGFRPASATFQAYDLGNNIAESLFGGIFLWKNRLNENAGDYIIPADNECVGYGCELANNTENNMMGSYNTSESGALENGYRHVWDFTTNQANGEISAVSLVPKITGRLGLGLEMTKVNTSLFVSSATSFYELKNNSYPRPSTILAYPFLYVKGDYVYAVKTYNLQYSSSYDLDHVSRNGKKLLIQKIRFPRNKMHLLEKYNVHNFVEEEFSIQLPDELTLSSTATKWYGFCNYDNGHIYLGLTNSSHSTNLSLQICKINIESHACKVIPINLTFPNDTYYFGSSSSIIDYHMNLTRYAGVYNNKFVTTGRPYMGDTYNSGYVDLSAPTVFQRFERQGGNDGYDYFTDIYGTIGKYLYVGAGNIRLLNLETGVCSYINLTSDMFEGITNFSITLSMGYIGQLVQNVDNPNETYTYARYNDSSAKVGYFMRNQLPHVMTTKNNLDTAVTKTSGQTMKVTYVLTEV